MFIYIYFHKVFFCFIIFFIFAEIIINIQKPIFVYVKALSVNPIQKYKNIAIDNVYAILLLSLLSGINEVIKISIKIITPIIPVHNNISKKPLCASVTPSLIIKCCPIVSSLPYPL